MKNYLNNILLFNKLIEITLFLRIIFALKIRFFVEICCKYLCSNDDIVDRNMDQFNKESDKAHDRETDSCCESDFLKFFLVWFSTSSNQSDRIFGELFAWFDELVDVVEHVGVF